MINNAKGSGQPLPFAFHCLSALTIIFLEVFLSDAACRACPVFRKVFERGSGGYASFRGSFCGIVDISADDAYILIHDYIVFGQAVQFSDQF